MSLTNLTGFMNPFNPNGEIKMEPTFVDLKDIGLNLEQVILKLNQAQIKQNEINEEIYKLREEEKVEIDKIQNIIKRMDPKPKFPICIVLESTHMLFIDKQNYTPSIIRYY